MPGSTTARARLVDSARRLIQSSNYAAASVDETTGQHVDGAPVSDGYAPLRLQVGRLEGLTVGEIDMRVLRPVQVAGLDEGFVVYDGAVRMTAPLLFTSI